MNGTDLRDPATAGGWQRWVVALPFVVLAVGTAVGLATARSQGHGPVRIAWLVALVVVTAVVLVVAAWLRGRPGAQRTLAAAYGVRTALAFAMTWVNPFLALFAFVGYVDAFDVLSRRWARVGMLVTAVAVAGAQSGGLPPRTGSQWAVLAVLVLFNGAIASAFTHFHRSVEQTSSQRAAVITELERVNAELEGALSDNAALSATVLAQARQAGVAEERERLAREIHDTIAQDLAGIVAQLQAVAADPDSSPARVETAHRLAHRALVEARRSVQDLGPAPLSGRDLPTALRGVISQWATTSTAPAELVVTGDPVDLHADLEATVVRIAQETLTNVAKHAGAARVGVTLSYVEDGVLLDVRDDGVGFDPGCRGSGFGLRGMRQRAERVAGVLEVESGPGRGTAVSLRVPLVRAGSLT